MALFQATDDPNRGAPYAICGTRDIMFLLAPTSCVLVPGSVPPLVTFNRYDYFWLSLCLSSSADAVVGSAPLDAVSYGTHVLSWAAMHAIVAQAVSSGFSVVNPTDMFSAVKQALQWASLHVPMLRTLSVNDFEQLPAIAQGNRPDSWWLNIPYSLWVQDGLYHALCHAMGYAGSFWDAPSRGADSRLHLSLVLYSRVFTGVGHDAGLFLWRICGSFLRMHYDTSSLLALPVRLVRITNGADRALGLLSRDAHASESGTSLIHA